MFLEATPGHKDAAGGECKADVQDGHGMHSTYKSGNQNGGQKTAVNIPVDQSNGPMLLSGRCILADQESTAFDQKGREFSAPKPGQPQLDNGAEQNQECRLPAGRVHLFNRKRAQPEETLIPVKANVGISPKQSALSFGEETAIGHQQAFGGEPKANVEDGHGMQPSDDNRNQSSGQRKAIEGQTHKPAEPPGKDRPACQENAAYNEHKKAELSENPEQPQLDNGAEQMQECRLPRGLSCGEVAAIGHREDGHGVQPFGENRNQSSGQMKAIEGHTHIPARQRGKQRPACQETAAYNEQKKAELSESTPERTSSALKRKLAFSARHIKKQKPLWQWSCPTCGANTTSRQDKEDHLAGRRHQLNVEALQPSKSDTAEPSTKANSVWDRITAKNTKSSCGGGKENVAKNIGLQQEEKPGNKAMRVEPESLAHRKDAGTGKAADWKSRFYCKLCDVQCNSEKMLTSHLGGRKHRGRLEEGD